MENFWEGSDNLELLTTDSIFEIMKEQSDYLSRKTENRVSAVFEEVPQGTMETNMLRMVGSIASVTSLFGAIEESSKKIDANELYRVSEYEFALYTDVYKFRIFRLLIKPIYPIVLILDEGINEEISSYIKSLCKSLDKPNEYSLENEVEFSNVLKKVLQCRKVQYIVRELSKQGEESKTDDLLNETKRRLKVIICEGMTDELILEAVAERLNRRIKTVRADGKNSIIKFVAEFCNSSEFSFKDYMVVVDSDGDEIGTRKLFENRIPANFQIVVINNTIEDWFFPKRADFSTFRNMKNIKEIVESADFEKIESEHTSFKEVVDFIKKD